MDVQQEQVSLFNGKPVVNIALINGDRAQVNILNYGAIVKDILLPGNAGHYDNMVLSYDTAEEYYDDENYLGCTVGRYANRISGGILSVNNTHYQLSKNESSLGNHLHGGYSGFNKKLWEIKDTFIKDQECGVTLTLGSSHLEEGYPGNLQTEVSYIFSNSNELLIHYRAFTDRPTVVNLTNHSYFNLSGGEIDISAHTLAIYADEFTPSDSNYIPLGTIQSVDRSIYDLRTPREVAGFMHQIDTQNFCVNNNRQLKPVALLSDPGSSRTLEVRTTYPGLQLYCGNYLSGKFHPYAGICLEPDFYPDSPNQPQFPSPLLMPGQEYSEVISYKFG